MSRPRRRIGSALACLAALALTTALGCGSESTPMRTPPGRVLVVGIDGASLRMVDPLIERGDLPNLAALRRDGASGALTSLVPIQSPRIWNSIATGKRPDKHGIVAFAHADAQRVLRLYLGSDRKTLALWNIASHAGLSVGVINWWNTFPPERIDGVMVSDHLHASEIAGREALAHAQDTPHGALTFPEDWEERLLPLLDVEGSPVAIEDPFSGNDALPHVDLMGDRLVQAFRDDAAILRIAQAVEDAERPDLMFVFFPGIDRVSHFLWGMIEPPDRYPEELRPTPEGRAAGRAAFEAYYAYADALLGRLLEPYGPQDLIVVVSDHGFEQGVDLGILTGVHRTKEALDGVIFARGPGIEAGATVEAASVLDVTPTILAWLGLPVGDDMDGRVADFLDAPEIRRVPTHDTRPVEWLETAASGSDDRILEDLRALGYFEEEADATDEDADADAPDDDGRL